MPDFLFIQPPRFQAPDKDLSKSWEERHVQTGSGKLTVEIKSHQVQLRGRTQVCSESKLWSPSPSSKNKYSRKIVQDIL